MFFISVQLIANGQSFPVVVRPVVKESKQERLRYTQNMVAKIVPALRQRVAMTESAQVSQLLIQLLDYLCTNLILLLDFSKCSYLSVNIQKDGLEKVESSDNELPWFNGTYLFETYGKNQPSWKSFSRAIWKHPESNNWVIGNLSNRGNSTGYINSRENSAYLLPNCTNWKYTKTSSHGTTSTDINLKCLEGKTPVYILQS